MLQDALLLLLLLLCLQKHYSTLIAQGWQSQASSLLIWLVMEGRGFPRA